jgi:hypothetical protein
MLLTKDTLLAANHELVKTGALEPAFTIVLAPNRKIVCYPCCGGDALNVVSYVCA